MPLEPYQKDWLIQQSGLNPAEYTLDSDEQNIIPKPTKNQPTLGYTPYEPKLDANPGFSSQKSGNQNSALSTIVKSGLEAAPGAVGAGVGASLALGVGGALAPETMGASMLIPAAVGFLGAMGGGATANAARQAIEPQAWQQNVAQARAENPKSALLGELAAMPLGGLNPNPMNVVRAGRGLISHLSGLGADAGDLAQLANVGIGAGMGAAQPAYNYLTGQGSLGDIGLGLGTGALFNSPNRIGQALGFHPVGEQPTEFTREMIDRKSRSQPSTEAESNTAEEEVSPSPGLAGPYHLPADKPVADGDGNLVWKGKKYKMDELGMNKLAKDSDAMWDYRSQFQSPNAEMSAMESEGGGVTSEQADAAEQNRKLKAQVEFLKQQAEEKAKAAQEPKEPEQPAANTETPATPEQIFTASHDAVIQNLRDNNLAEAADKLEALRAKVQKGEALEPNDAGTLKQWNEIANRPEFKSAADKRKESTESSLNDEEPATTPQQRITAKNLELEGLSGKLTQKWINFAQKLGYLRNVKLEQDGSLSRVDPITGKSTPVAGQTLAREGLKQVLAKINPNKAALDTPVHEIFHSFINDMRESPRGRDRTLVDRYDNLTENTQDYKDWATAREAQGKNADVEEFQATNAGMEAVNRAISKEGEFKRWFNDMSSYVKTRFGQHGTIEDFQRVMHYKLLHDPEFSKVFGGKSIASGARGIPANQDESSLNPDYDRYQEVQAEIKRAYQSGDSDALQKAFQENEDIKNRQPKKGFPPEKYSDESNLISPKHEQVIDLLHKAAELTDNAALEPGNAKEIQDILAKQVDWPKNSKVGESLRSSSFDNMDPYHWADLNKLYNAEQFQYEDENQKLRAEKNKEATTASIQPESTKEPEKQLASTVSPAKVEAPRENVEAAPVSPKELEKTPTKPLETTVPIKRPKQENVAKVQGMIPTEETLFKNMLPEEFNRKEILSAKQRKARLKLVKAGWDTVDAVESPVGARHLMDELKKQYDATMEKKRGAATMDEYDHATAQQQNLMAQMYHLESKWKIPMPTPDELPKYSEESPLNEAATPEMSDEDVARNSRIQFGSMMEGVTHAKDIFDHIKSVKKMLEAKDYPVEHSLDAKELLDSHPNKLKSILGNLDGQNVLDEYHRLNQLKDKADAPFNLIDNIDNPENTEGFRKNQEESPLASGDEPNLNWRLSEMREELQKHDLPYSSLGLTRTLLDSIIHKHGEAGQAFSDAYHGYASDKDAMYGKYMAPILKAAKGLSQGDLKKVENIRIMESRDRKSYTDRLTDNQLKLHDAIQDSMQQWQKDQAEANQPVTTMTAKGQYVKQSLKPDEFYHPNRPSPQAIETLTERPNSQAAKDLRNDFIQLRQKLGDSKELAEKRLDSMLTAYDNGESNQARFREVRMVDKSQLPDSWMRNDLLKNMNNFFNRVSTDRAYHDNFETNPEVAKSIGLTKTPWGKDYPGGNENIGELQGSTPVHNALEKIYGEPFDKDEANLKLANRIATSLFLGPLTNIHIAASSVANALQYIHPTEAIPAMAKAIGNITDGYQKALTQGYAKKNLTRFSDIMDINNSAHERWSALGNTIAKINGRDATDAFTKGFLQNIGDWVIKSKIVSAESGDKEAINLLQHVNPEWKPGADLSSEDIDKMASSFAGMIHGTHDPRTLPGWMLKDTAIQPFFQLASWNIAQTNAWMRHVWTPAKQGNLTPFLMSTLGSIGGGYVIGQLRELIGDKKSPIPELSEIIHSSKGLEGNIPLDLYKAAALSSYVGFGGILSTAAKVAGDVAFKNIPQSATFPLDEVMSTLVHRPLQAIGAIVNDPNIKSMDDYVRVASKLATDLVKENIQFGRIAVSWLARDPNALPNENYYKMLGQKESQLRRFKMVEGLPYEFQTASTGNPYMDLATKQFKHTPDLREAAGEARGLVQGAVEQSGGNPDVMASKLHKLKANVYETLPDPETQPLMFSKYRAFLQKEIGTEETNNLIRDYYIKKAFNQAKSQMIPSVSY